MRDIHQAAWTQLAKRTDHGYLYRRVEMLLVKYQHFKMATIQRAAIQYTQHLYRTGPPYNHTVHMATHPHPLQQEHVKKMDSGLDQIRIALQLSLVTVCLP